MTLAKLAVTALAVAALMPNVEAQQELYALARGNTIWRIDGFDTASPNPALVTNWGITPGSSAPPCSTCAPVGLERDPSTGDFFVLLAGWNVFTEPAQLLRVDNATGATSFVCEVPFLGLSGLSRRWDGKLMSIDQRQRLVIIDPVTCTSSSVTLSAPIGPNMGPVYPFVPFDIDARGDVQVLSDPSVRLDPVSGVTTPSGIAPFPGNTAGGFVRTRDGELYAGDLFPGNLYRYDALNATWTSVFVGGNITMNNIYDLVLTNPAAGDGFEQVCIGVASSSGEIATLEFLGTSSLADDDLTLATRGLPANTFGMYLMGDAAGLTAVGAGRLCIAPTVYRYTSSFSAVQETYRFDVDLAALPDGQPAMANTTRIFQFWFRDTVAGVATSQLSSAAAVTFR